MRARRQAVPGRAAAASALAFLLVLAGCSVPEPTDWTYHDSGLLRPADDLRTIGDAWRESLVEGTVRANVPADAACYFQLEGGAIQDDVVCGPTRRAGHSATIWQQAPITSFYEKGGKVALTVGGDGSFRDVDPRSVGALRAADGTEPDLSVAIGPPRGTELAAGESVEVDARTRTADDRATNGGCLLTASALCTVDSAGDSGRRILSLAGREVLVVFQDASDAGYAAEPYDAAPGTRLLAVTIVNTRLQAGSGAGDLASLLPVGTEGALSGAEDGRLTAALTVGDEQPQDLGDLPQTTVSADEVLERISSDTLPQPDGGEPEGTTVRLVAVPEDEAAVVVVSDGEHDAAFRSDETMSTTTVPADQQDFFSVFEPYGDDLPTGMTLGVDGTLDLGGRKQDDTMPVRFDAAVSYLGSGDEQATGTDDEGRPRAITYRPKGAARAKYVPRVEIRDAELTTGRKTVPLEVSADDAEGAEARASGTADVAGLDADGPAASAHPDGEAPELWEVRLRARVVLHLDLADDQDGELPSGQPEHLEWKRDVDESPGFFAAPGYASVDGW